MANMFYDQGREGFADGSINWMRGDIRVLLVDGEHYIKDIRGHRTIADIPQEARLSATATLEEKTCKYGDLGSAPFDFVGLSGAIVTAMVVFQYDDDPTVARLIAYLDDVDGLPVVANGGKLKFTWPDNIMAAL